MSDPLKSLPDRQRELFAKMSTAASGHAADEVAGAAINVLLNALRQSYASRDAAAKAFDEAAGRAKALLLDQHYHNDGSRRNVFPFTQVIEVGEPNWHKNTFMRTG